MAKFLNEADELPAVSGENAAVTLIGAAHIWAARAKAAETKLSRVRRWRTVAILALLPYLPAAIWLWLAS